MVTVSKKQVHMLFTVLPGSAAMCYALSVQLKWVGAEGLELSHLLFKHSSVNKMLIGLGKQTMLLVEICWECTLRQCHWEGCGHLQLHRIWAGLCMWCKNMLRQFQDHLAGWLQSDVIKGKDNSSRHFAQLEGSATYCQADNCNMGHADIHASKCSQQLFVLTAQQCGAVLVQPRANSVESLVVGQESIQAGLVHLTQAHTLPLPLVAHDHQLAWFRQADLNQLEGVLRTIHLPSLLSSFV